MSQSVRFDSTNEHFTATLSLGSQANWTVSFWGRIAVDRNTWSTFMMFDALSILTKVDGTTLTLWDSIERPLASAPSLTAGTWYHIVCVGVGAAVTVYYKPDGGSYSTTTATIASTPVMNNLTVGWDNVSGEELNGNLASIKIWTAALNSTEAQTEGTQYLPVLTTNLAACYKFEGESTGSPGPGLNLGTGASWEAGPNIPILVTPPEGPKNTSATHSMTALAR